MKLHSPAFADMGRIPQEYTCDGEGLLPPFEIVGIPAEAVTLALIMHDPDAPSGDFVHLVAWNIPPVASIGKGALPTAGTVLGAASDGTRDYVSPCPPNGTHRYVFKVYALRVSLALPGTATRDDLRTAMHSHIIADAEYTGTYSRE